MLTKYTGYFILISLLTTGCTNNVKEAGVDLSDSIIHSEGITYFENNEVTYVAAPCDGKIVSIKAGSEHYTNAGKTIALIENSDILILQKEYLEARNDLDLKSREFTRQGDLTLENATSLKRMEIAQYDYRQADLKYQSLRRQLKVLGINPDSIKPGNLQTWLAIVSPVKGIITSAPPGKGHFVKKGDPLFEIIGSKTLLLQLEIPEASVWKVNKGQLIRFNTVSDSTLIMDARIIKTPIAVDPVKHTAVIIAEPIADYDLLLPGMTVSANIYLSDSKQ